MLQSNQDDILHKEVDELIREIGSNRAHGFSSTALPQIHEARAISPVDSARFDTAKIKTQQPQESHHLHSHFPSMNSNTSKISRRSTRSRTSKATLAPTPKSSAEQVEKVGSQKKLSTTGLQRVISQVSVRTSLTKRLRRSTLLLQHRIGIFTQRSHRSTKKQNELAALLLKDINTMANEHYESIAVKRTHTWILPIFSPAKMVWDAFVAIVMFIFIALLPLELSFNLSSTMTETKICLLLADFVFNFDILLYFRTSGLDPRTHEEITDFKLIARKYLRCWFWIDVLSAYPTLIIQTWFDPLGGITQPFNLTKLLRLSVLLRAQKLLKRPVFHKILIQWLAFGINPATIRLVEITALYLLLHHYLACFYYMTVIAELEYLGDASSRTELWELPFDLNGTVVDQYVGSFFQAATVMGAYTLRPKTTIERLFTGFGLVVAIVSNSCLFGIVADLLKARSKVVMEQYDQMQAISNHLRACQIKEDVKLRILDFYNGAWAIENAHHPDKLFTHLPDNLQVLLSHHLHGLLSTQAPFLRYLGPEGLMKVIMALKTLVVLKDEIVVQQGEKPHAIYFIDIGHVEVYELAKNGNRVLLAMLRAGNTFGEDSLLSGECASANVVALTYCKFYVLYKEAFDLIHSQHQPKNNMNHRLTINYYRRTSFLDIAHSIHTELTVLKKWNHTMALRKRRLSSVVQYMQRVKHRVFPRASLIKPANGLIDATFCRSNTYHNERFQLYIEQLSAHHAHEIAKRRTLLMDELVQK